MVAATEEVERKTDFAAVGQRRRWNQAVEARRKGVTERPADDGPVARENVAGRLGQTCLVVVTEDNMAPASEVAAVAMPANVQSVQKAVYVGS